MDALALLLPLLFKSFVILLPAIVGGLAFRRLTRSKSSNAWIYSVTCLFTAVIIAGLVPWAIGVSVSNWAFFVLAAFSPAMWYGITAVCDVPGKGNYKIEAEEEPVVFFKAQRRKPKPLLLQDPVPEEPTPVFSHSGLAKIEEAPVSEPVVASAPTKAVAQIAPHPPETPVRRSAPEGAKKSVLEVAREMRRNASTENRRPKLLPAPAD